MVRKTYAPEQIINRLREAEVHINRGIPIAEASRKTSITHQICYRWRKGYGGLRIGQARKLKNLEKENAFIRSSEPCQNSRYAEIPGIKLAWCFR
ncbi:transposase [Chloroflexota bacterium]